MGSEYNETCTRKRKYAYLKIIVSLFSYLKSENNTLQLTEIRMKKKIDLRRYKKVPLNIN